MINVEWLAEHGPCKDFAAGEVIPCPAAKAGDPKVMYILISGAVDVYKKGAAGDIKKVSSVAAGDVFGGREFFFGAGDHFYRAAETARAFVLTKESFNDLSWSQPDMLFEILRSAYMPPRAPSATPAKPAAPVPARVSAPAPAPAEQAKPEPPPAAAPAAAPPKEVSGAIYLPGHKIYTEKEFPMNEKLVFAKEYTCPLCKKTFQDFRVFRSKLYENRPMRYDMRKFYTGFNAEWYDIITCHKCFFSTFYTFYANPKPVMAALVEDALAAARAEVMIDFAAPRDINHVFTMHYLALISCEGYKSQSKQLRAKIWGNISWLYEDAEDKEMEIAAATKAAEAYEQVYTETHLTPVQEQITCLSIAGMQYRAGMEKNLKKFLFAAKTNTMGDRTYAKLADDFLYELRLSEDEHKDEE